MHTATFGLIGYPLSHSFSPGYFAAKFASEGIDAVYKLFPLADVQNFLPILTENPGINGLNVTIPYKEAVMPFLYAIDPAATAIGAVNCIAISNGKTTGYNTDAIGFENSLLPLLKQHHTKALVLGNGGASKAVIYTLKKLGIAYTLVSRKAGTGITLYTDITADTVRENTLIINTTPLGMYPETEACPPIPYGAIGPQHLLYDLIYNPEATKFLTLGQATGAAIKNGLEMLHLQAEASWDIWCQSEGK